MLNSFDKTHVLNRARHPVMATIATSNLDASVSAYEASLGYQLIEQGTLPNNLAAHWDAEELKGARYAVLRPESGSPVFFRFVEIAGGAEAQKPIGWFALEICVEDVEALYERLVKGGPFKPFAEPMPLSFTDRVYPMQCKGPSGEILYLNQVRGSLPDIDLPIAGSFVDHLFIAILSAPDMEAANEFYCDLLDATVNERHELAYKTINRVHGLPLDTMHKLSTLGAPRHVGLEIDQYPSEAKLPDPSETKRIGEGILMVSYVVDGLSERQVSLSGALRDFNIAPYGDSSSLVLRGPANERVELIEFTR